MKLRGFDNNLMTAIAVILFSFTVVFFADSISYEQSVTIDKTLHGTVFVFNSTQKYSRNRMD